MFETGKCEGNTMITCKNISKSFGNREILCDVNFDFLDGKMYCIQGTSGSGKTTLLHILGLIEKPSEGEVLFNGNKVKNRHKLYRDTVSFMFQDFGLMENETVEYNLSILPRFKKASRKKRNKMMLDALEFVGCSKELLQQRVYSLSGGEQQRIAFAKIILKNPQVILADEPTASLDDFNKKIVMKYLKNEVQQGKLVIIVSHDSWIIEQGDVKLKIENKNIEME